MNKLEIAEVYLDDALRHAASKLVGELMSQFESISNLNELKICVKNTVYQNFRDLQGQIKAFDAGVKFISPKSITTK